MLKATYKKRHWRHKIKLSVFFFTAIITKSDASRMHLNYSADVFKMSKSNKKPSLKTREEARRKWAAVFRRNAREV